jgi:hypothetical protein
MHLAGARRAPQARVMHGVREWGVTSVAHLGAQVRVPRRACRAVQLRVACTLVAPCTPRARRV